ncbi:hypothetical protein C8R45DRAFT_927925 [Mycena sanguinolenta]|nr:hypothetical protein C8R45DRAFT_927925 [Mycena sanguinolenta]
MRQHDIAGGVSVSAIAEVVEHSQQENSPGIMNLEHNGVMEPGPRSGWAKIAEMPQCSSQFLAWTVWAFFDPQNICIGGRVYQKPEESNAQATQIEPWEAGDEKRPSFDWHCQTQARQREPKSIRGLPANRR